MNTHTTEEELMFKMMHCVRRFRQQLHASQVSGMNLQQYPMDRTSHLMDRAPHPMDGSPHAMDASPCSMGGLPHEPRASRGPHRPPILSRERILTVLLEYEEGLRQKQLIERLLVNASSMSEFITRLEDNGYIERSVDPKDKRATLITLTEKGRARANELQDERSDTLKKYFAVLTDDEKTQLLCLLNKMTNAFEQEDVDTEK